MFKHQLRISSNYYSNYRSCQRLGHVSNAWYIEWDYRTDDGLIFYMLISKMKSVLKLQKLSYNRKKIWKWWLMCCSVFVFPNDDLIKWKSYNLVVYIKKKKIVLVPSTNNWMNCHESALGCRLWYNRFESGIFFVQFFDRVYGSIRVPAHATDVWASVFLVKLSCI